MYVYLSKKPLWSLWQYCHCMYMYVHLSSTRANQLNSIHKHKAGSCIVVLCCGPTQPHGYAAHGTLQHRVKKPHSSITIGVGIYMYREHRDTRELTWALIFIQLARFAYMCSILQNYV